VNDVSVLLLNSSLLIFTQYMQLLFAVGFFAVFFLLFVWVFLINLSRNTIIGLLTSKLYLSWDKNNNGNSARVVSMFCSYKVIHIK